MEINGPRCLCLQTPIEKTVRVRQRRSFEKVNLDVILESPKRAYVAVGAPHGCMPLDLLLEIRIRVIDDVSQTDHHSSAPVGESCDLLVDLLRCVHINAV